MNNQEKLKQILASVFNLGIDQITEDASPDSIENWDSLNHLNLVLALEEGFGVSFLKNKPLKS